MLVYCNNLCQFLRLWCVGMSLFITRMYLLQLFKVTKYRNTKTGRKTWANRKIGQINEMNQRLNINSPTLNFSIRPSDVRTKTGNRTKTRPGPAGKYGRLTNLSIPITRIMSHKQQCKL